MVSTPPRFPASLRAFQTEFADAAACERYLAACRWPDGFRCPRCEHDRAFFLTERRRWQCANRDCRHQGSSRPGPCPLLARLRRDGRVTTTWRESASGPPRRYYAITSAGRHALDAFRADWVGFRDTVDGLLGTQRRRIG